MTEKAVLTARIPGETKERIRKYARENEITMSEAAWRLIEMGIAATQPPYDYATPDEPSRTWRSLLRIGGGDD